MDTALQFWRFGMVVFLVVLGISACGDEKTESDQSVSAPTMTDAVESPTIPVIEPVISLEPEATNSPVPFPTATATLNFQIEEFASSWALGLRYEIVNGGLFLEVDEWIYSGQAILTVQDNGVVDGQGVLYPAPLDALCTVTTANSEGLPFSITGSFQSDGTSVWLDMRVVPQDYFIMENYTILCPHYNEPRLIAENYFWPMLGQIDALRYTLPMAQGQGGLDYHENLSARTNDVLRGDLHIELMLQR